MPKVSPVGNQYLFRKASMGAGEEIAMSLKKTSGQLSRAEFFTYKEGALSKRNGYLLGNNEYTPGLIENIKNKISEICAKAKDGAELFADIMGWLR